MCTRNMRITHSNKIRFFSGCLFILIIFYLIGCASNNDNDTNEEKIYPEADTSIRKKITEDDACRIIVDLSGEWDNNPDLPDDQEKELIHQAQQDLLDALDANNLIIGNILEFTLIPSIAFEIYDEKTLDFLIFSPLVSFIEEDIALSIS
jgi:hypothetical protein